MVGNGRDLLVSMASTKTAKTSKRGVAPERMTDKMLAFVGEYIIDFNAARAAIAVGSGAQMGYKWLAHPLVQKALAKALHDRLERNHLTQDDVLEHLRTALFLDPLEFAERHPSGDGFRIRDLEEVPLEIRRCLQKIKYREKRYRGGDNDGELVESWWEFESMSKDACQALAMKHHGLLIEKQEVKVDIGENLATAIKDAEKNRGNRVIDASFIEQVAQQKALTVTSEDAD